MRFLLFVIARLAVAGFCLLTFAYAVLNGSPFAFDMFIKPQLFPWLTTFVAWHHVWFAAISVISALTLISDLSGRRLRTGASNLAHWLAIAYVACAGAVSIALFASPFLPTLWNDARALPTAIASLVPLIWLAVIDHLASHADLLDIEDDARETTGPGRLFLTCVGTAIVLWSAHLLRAVVHAGAPGRTLAWTVTALWALALSVAVFALAFTLLTLVTAVAARSVAPRRFEYSALVALIGAGLCAFLRRAVFPTISLAPAEATVLAIWAGAAFALTWSGLMFRRPTVRRRAIGSAGDVLFAPTLGRTASICVLLTVVGVTALALNAIERLDWNFVAQRSLLLIEAVLVFGLALRTTRGAHAGRWSSGWLQAWPVAALGALVMVPLGAARLSAWTGDRALAPEAGFERQAAGEIAFKTFADLLVARSGFDDPGYQQFLQRHASGTDRIVVPDVDFSAPIVRAAHGRRPDIFVFVIDSLRRDYLSPYNPSVTFTPNIDAFGAENFVFRNAFTRHGGTELAMASIWSGATAVRKVRAHDFARMNALEKLVNTNGYRVAINDFTIAEHLRPATPKTTIDPGVPSVETDLCRNLESLSAHLDQSAADTRPVFGYLAPMNVHILNTQRGRQASLDGDYPGFYAPYASRLRRIDACFGRFVSYLKARDRYDDSIIVFTSDHGDSLGEDGHWGHGSWLYPEDVRVPLIVRIPEALRPAVTTDLARLAFSTDIAPTLYALTGRPVRDLGPLFGDPLFVPAGEALPDRRRESYVLTSSYGATFALLRRNGKFLYISDLVDWRESAFDLSSGPIGSPVPVDSALRRVNQRRIREQVAAVGELYGVPREPGTGGVR